jgi:hypothetical protein
MCGSNIGGPARSKPRLTMRREPVSSSSIAAIGYDARSETLEVEFVNGRLYRYRSVEADVHKGFRAAGSKGTFFNAHIRDAYPFERLR